VTDADEVNEYTTFGSDQADRRIRLGVNLQLLIGILDHFRLRLDALLLLLLLSSSS